MEKKQELRTLEQLENEIELATNSLRDTLAPLGIKPEWQRQRNLEQAVAKAQEIFTGVAHDLELRRPMMVMTVDLSHPCSDCAGMENNLGDDYCKEYCSDPTARLSYTDPTEASAEEDGPEQSRLEERINYG